MDDKELPNDLNRFVPEGVNEIELEERREAIRTFINNPDAAVQLYPDLKQELIVFFQHSSNPYLNTDHNGPTKGQEGAFEQWESAHIWALRQLA